MDRSTMVKRTKETKTGGTAIRHGTPGRRRLPANVRVDQILDAALEEFTLRGFASTRIDDIAARAGLSKGGIYTHFGSKDALLEALLRRVAASAISEELCGHPGPVTVERMVELLAGDAYMRATSEQAIATLRLLVAESLRVPDHVDAWRNCALQAYASMIGALLKTGVDNGSLRPGVATEHPWLLVAPIAHICMQLAMGGNTASRRELERNRKAYARLLRELLTFPDSG